MIEFLQNYWIWILLIGGMFLMHRLGIGCCGGHTHGQDHGHGGAPEREPKPRDTKMAEGKRPEAAAASSAPRRSCH